MEKLALDGGPKAYPGMQGKKEPKIGMDEFLAIAERFGLSAEAVKRIRAAVSNADLQDGEANLARYYCPNPKLPAGPKFEALARKKFGVKYALR